MPRSSANPLQLYDFIPVNPGMSILPVPCDVIMVDTDAAQVAIEPASGSQRKLITAGAFIQLQNGDFAAATGWTAGAGWTIAANKATHAAAGGTNDLYQANLAMGGQKAAVAFTMTYRAGTSVIAKLGTGAGAARASSATFIEIITASAGAAPVNLIFTPTNDLDADIDDVGLYPCTMPLSNKTVYPFQCRRIVAVTAGIVYAGYLK